MSAVEAKDVEVVVGPAVEVGNAVEDDDVGACLEASLSLVALLTKHKAKGKVTVPGEARELLDRLLAFKAASAVAEAQAEGETESVGPPQLGSNDNGVVKPNPAVKWPAAGQWPEGCQPRVAIVCSWLGDAAQRLWATIRPIFPIVCKALWAYFGFSVQMGLFFGALTAMFAAMFLSDPGGDYSPYFSAVINPGFSCLFIIGYYLFATPIVTSTAVGQRVQWWLLGLLLSLWLIAAIFLLASPGALVYSRFDLVLPALAWILPGSVISGFLVPGYIEEGIMEPYAIADKTEEEIKQMRAKSGVVAEWWSGFVIPHFILITITVLCYNALQTDTDRMVVRSFAWPFLAFFCVSSLRTLSSSAPRGYDVRIRQRYTNILYFVEAALAVYGRAMIVAVNSSTLQALAVTFHGIVEIARRTTAVPLDNYMRVLRGKPEPTPAQQRRQLEAMADGIVASGITENAAILIAAAARLCFQGPGLGNLYSFGSVEVSATVIGLDTAYSLLIAFIVDLCSMIAEHHHGIPVAFVWDRTKWACFGVYMCAVGSICCMSFACFISADTFYSS